MRIVVTGAAGMLGQEVVRRRPGARPRGDRAGSCRSRDRGRRCGRRRPRRVARCGGQLCRLHRRRWRRGERGRRDADQRRGRGPARRARPEGRRQDRPPLQRLRLRWLRSGGHTSSPTCRRPSRLMVAPNRPGRPRWRSPTPVTSSSAPRGCSGSAGRTSSRPCSGSGESNRRCSSCRSGRLAHLHPPSRRGPRRPGRERRLRHPSHRRSGPMLLVRVRTGDLRSGRGRVQGDGGDHRDACAPGAAPALLGSRLRAPPSRSPFPLEEGPRRVPGRAPARGSGGMRLLVAGGAGSSDRPTSAPARGTPGRHGRVLDKLTYAGRPENLQGFRMAASSSSRATSRTRTRWRAAWKVATRSSTSRPSPTSTARSSPRASSSRPTSFGTFVLLEAARDAGIRHLQVSTDEVYGSIEPGSFTERSPLEPSSPYSASKAGGDLIVSAYHHTYGADALIVRGSNNYGPRQHPEKLIPLVHPERAAGDPLPVYGDGMQVRNWLFVEDFCAGDRPRAARGEAGEAYNVGGPDELPNIEVVQHDPRADRPRRVADRVRHRPPRPRPPLLAGLREGSAALGWEAQVTFEEGLARTVALVSRQRLVVGADPLRRVPGVLRAPVRQSPRRLMALAPARPGSTASS